MNCKVYCKLKNAQDLMSEVGSPSTHIYYTSSVWCMLVETEEDSTVVKFFPAYFKANKGKDESWDNSALQPGDPYKNMFLGYGYAYKFDSLNELILSLKCYHGVEIEIV